MTAATRRQLIRFAVIGTLAVTVGLRVFRTLANVGWSAESAALVGGAVSLVVHFVLNKYADLRKHDCSLRAGLGAYCAAVSVWRVVTAPPVLAELLTFGARIAAVLRRRRRAL